MATPSVLTVPSMYGDGILYSGPTVYSNEIVVNGNFATDSDWIKSSGVTISNNKATINVTGGGFEYIQQNISYTVGEKYIIQLTVQGLPGSSGKQMRFQDNSSNLGTLFRIKTLTENEQHFQVEWIPNANSNSIHIARSDTGDFSFTVNRVSVKKINQGSDFDFTRSTTGTRINEEGYIENVPYNLLRHSESILSTTNWAIIGATTELGYIDPKGGLNAVKVTPTGNDPYVYGNMQNLSYKTYTGSIYVKGSAAADGLSIRLWLIRDNVEFPFEDFTLTTDWQRLEITKTFNQAITTQAYFRIDSPNSNPPLTGIETFLWGAQVVPGTKNKPYLPTTDRVNLPRLNYPVYGGCPSLLVEPQKTNNIVYSNDFLQSEWGGTQGLSVTLNNAISPEGILNAATVTQDGTNPNPALATNASILTGQIYTFSMFVKNVNLNGFVRLSHVTSGSTGCWFNLDNGTIGTVNSVNATIQKYPNNWYRITNTFVSTTGGNALLAFLGLSDTDGTTTLTGSNQSVLAYGAQLEFGSYATSYIPTSGAIFTRGEDKAENAGVGTTDTFNDDEGVLYAELRFDQIVSGNYIGIDDGTTNNRIIIGAEGSNIRVYSPGFTFGVNDLPMFDINKIAFSWQTNLRKLFINGVKLEENTSAYTGPTGLNQLAFDSGSAIQIFDGEAKAVAVYKTALTDTELSNLTSYNNHDLFIPYRSRMQMINADQELQCTEHDITRFL